MQRTWRSNNASRDHLQEHEKSEELSNRHPKVKSGRALLRDPEVLTRASTGKMLLFWMGTESFMGAGFLRENCDLYFYDLEW